MKRYGENRTASEKKRLDDRGAALVTVIVVVVVLSILATTFLYISGMNYFMKITDLKTKESFYEAETALEEVKAELMELASEAGKEAYSEVMISYASVDSFTRYSLYQTAFFAKLQELWEAKRGDPAAPLTYLQVLQTMVDPAYSSSIMLSADPSAGQIDVSHVDEGYALLKGIVLEYTDANGYTTIISTDYLISVPTVDWSVNQAYADWSDGVFSPEKLKRGNVDLSECVQYYNWVKK